MIIDVKQDEKEAKEWELGNTTEGISLNELAEVATQGLTFCEAYCSIRLWLPRRNPEKLKS